MKRILPVVILTFIGIITGLVFFGKFVFGRYDYHIQKKQNFEIYINNYSSDPNYRILKIYEDGVLVNEIEPIDIHQIPKLRKDRIINIHRYNTKNGGWWVFLYLITVGCTVVYLIIQICHLKCYFSDDNGYGYVEKCERRKCSGRFKCKFYDQIEKYDLIPHKKRFRLFWGYVN